MIASLARFFLDPFNIFLFLLIVTAGFYFFKKVKICKRLVLLSVFWLLIISTPFIPQLVLGSLEVMYDPVDVEKIIDNDEEYHIVVLGAGYSFNERLPPNTLLDQITLGRLVEGVRLFKQLPNSKLVTSGPYSNRRASQAEIVKRTAILLGVPEEAILTQSEPTNTYEEAKVYFENHYMGQKVIVVTNAAHMHRALSEFQLLGINVIPSPTNYVYKDKSNYRISIIPSLKNISNLRTGLYEYAALFRNYLRNS